MGDVVEHECQYKPVKDNPFMFICTICNNIHKCGENDCEHLSYNSDYTQVCTLTGLCFEQRMCELFTNTNKLNNSSDPVYIKRPKRDQQIKNKYLEREQILRIIECATTIVELTPPQISTLCNKILDLWSQFVSSMDKYNKRYVHRKDKRCFVVAIVLSLENGIMIDDNKFVVTPHKNIKCAKLNKKSEYPEFEVSDIRYGQTLIKKAFNGNNFDTRYSICIF